MKAFGRSIAVVAAAVAMSAGVLSSPASAATPEAPEFLGHPKAWGMATFTVHPNSVTPAKAMDVDNVGGGTWSYGVASGDNGLKRCYSNYTHPSKVHSSTAVMASQTDKQVESAGHWSNASIDAGWAYECHTYWAVY